MPDGPRIRIIIIEAQSETVVVDVLRELGASKEAIENTYIVTGQIGAVGTNATSGDSTFSQTKQEMISNDDLILLAMQLELVQTAMKEHMVDGPSAERDKEINQVERAQIAAANGDKSGALSHLKKVGTWTMAVAKEVSAEIVARTLARLLER